MFGGVRWSPLLAPQGRQIEAYQFLWRQVIRFQLGNTFRRMKNTRQACGVITNGLTLHHIHEIDASTNLILLTPIDREASHLFDRGK